MFNTRTPRSGAAPHEGQCKGQVWALGPSRRLFVPSDASWAPLAPLGPAPLGPPWRLLGPPGASWAPLAPRALAGSAQGPGSGKQLYSFSSSVSFITRKGQAVARRGPSAASLDPCTVGLGGGLGGPSGASVGRCLLARRTHRVGRHGLELRSRGQSLFSCPYLFTVQAGEKIRGFRTCIASLH